MPLTPAQWRRQRLAHQTALFVEYRSRRWGNPGRRPSSPELRSEMVRESPYLFPHRTMRLVMPGLVLTPCV
jgi:hypothetical protein